MEEYKIDTDQERVRFSDHLYSARNERIIFSSRFGNGKTTFLRDFFEKSTDYNAIHLYPVNYSVASNEDIFELIKFDVLFGLLSNKRLKLESSAKSFSTILKESINNNKGDVIKIFVPFLKCIPLVGDPLADSTDRIIEFVKKTEKEIKENQKDEKKIIEDYTDEFSEKIGAVYENNLYTQLIRSLVKRFKKTGHKSENPKKTVLIIDDMDRIDPDHIFRILNVFAAHQDLPNKPGNKFGFDKLVLVCDIDNIRSIFHHKYGTNTDFNGYIDKFYSIDVFNFNMSHLLFEETVKILDTVSGNKNWKTAFNNRATELYVELKWLLKSLVIKGILNTRSIVQLKNRSFNLTYYNLGVDGLKNTQLLGIVMLNFLKYVFGDYKAVELALKMNKDRSHETDKDNNHKDWSFEYSILPVLGLGNWKRHQVFQYNAPLIGKNDTITIAATNSLTPYGSKNVIRSIIDSNNIDNLNEKYANIDLPKIYYDMYVYACNHSHLQ